MYILVCVQICFYVLVLRLFHIRIHICLYVYKGCGIKTPLPAPSGDIDSKSDAQSKWGMAEKRSEKQNECDVDSLLRISQQNYLQVPMVVIGERGRLLQGERMSVKVRGKKENNILSCRFM